MMRHAADDEAQLIDALRRHDEAAFVQLVERYQGPLLRLALVYAGSRAVAEDVVQDTWLGVLQGIHKFEGRSSFKTWLFRILVNRARTRAEREGRTLPFSALGDATIESGESAVPAHRFLGASDPQWPHHWASPPKAWGGSPEDQLLARETLDLIALEIARLPPAQREVITLRDVEGWSAEEACNVLGITETNQRVLLHRARSRVRGALESHFDPG
ncbi:MAG: RNA polymerase subunit sigma-24 [Gemmatimonadetes bacterium]|nr:MAG: RNA polymerase subunit sigma-24 [Gemmatimonadota bacterium]